MGLIELYPDQFNKNYHTINHGAMQIILGTHLVVKDYLVSAE